ncbi:hypothetical protein BH10ACI4_BH10ACI4_01400 [soil metagenome]
MAYPNDHLPRHVHGFYAETEVIVDLNADLSVVIADRKNAIRPSNAKKSDINRILTSAAYNIEALIELWEGVHGKAHDRESGND